MYNKQLQVIANDLIRNHVQSADAFDWQSEWAKKGGLLYSVVTSSIVHQFKEISLSGSLLNFQKDVFYLADF